ncbi:prephenate dehydratase domain-containing protein [Legionella sp. D16C41]|uniref:prephenate dehydratase domain-containing protein n=1 Tax=Legionella sp. D16C41 TaxID=3402688 RepID=UPI003AF63F8C
MTIIMGVSGDKGSFSEEAAFLYAAQKAISPTFHYLIDMAGVLSAIERGDINFGILPVVNLQGGLVKPAFQAMGKYLFQPIDELWLHVRQCLLALPGVTKQQIKNIVSHPQGLAQCKDYIQKEFTGVVLHEWINTAKAARDLSEGIFSADTAVIAPKRAAELYGLDILATNIEDSSSNLTAFIVVKNREGL